MDSFLCLVAGLILIGVRHSKSGVSLSNGRRSLAFLWCTSYDWFPLCFNRHHIHPTFLTLLCSHRTAPRQCLSARSITFPTVASASCTAKHGYFLVVSKNGGKVLSDSIFFGLMWVKMSLVYGATGMTANMIFIFRSHVITWDSFYLSDESSFMCSFTEALTLIPYLFAYPYFFLQFSFSFVLIYTYATFCLPFQYVIF